MADVPAGDGLVRRAAARQVRRGEVVVFEPAGRWGGAPGRCRTQAAAWVIKRVAALAGDPVPAEVSGAVKAEPGAAVPEGALVVVGDGTSSADSRMWGYLPADRVLGVAAEAVLGPRVPERGADGFSRPEAVVIPRSGDAGVPGLVAAGLQGEQPGVLAARRHERVVRAAFGDPPIAEHHDEVGSRTAPSRCGRSARSSGAAGTAAAGRAPRLLRLGVETRAGLVQDEQVGASA